MEFGQHKYPEKFLPMGAVVTASGTGAEMNNGAVITNEETRQKAGVLGAHARFAVLDPYYTLSLPEKQVISGAFDTLSHCMETYFGSPRDIFRVLWKWKYGILYEACSCSSFCPPCRNYGCF